MTDPSTLTLLGIRIEADGSIMILTPTQAEYRATTPRELWEDITAIAADGVDHHPHTVALPAGEASEDGEPFEVVQEDRGEAPGQMLDDATARRAMAQAGDVFEEVLGQEWGAIGRGFAKAVRRNGPKLVRSVSRGGKNRKRRRSR